MADALLQTGLLDFSVRTAAAAGRVLRRARFSWSEFVRQAWFLASVTTLHLGSVIRSADALGANGVVVTGHAVDLHDPRTLRATTGSSSAHPPRTPTPPHRRSGGSTSVAAVSRCASSG
ncbi:hypothetical protein [Saccharopolyspora erythraea]|uniref:Uncharacterized protein n=1 Tax=Saccharopolyspora erythraea (strain ATCC 11635 / DSM 40517 / JCM 4748 / NBRC 13426 / NCIMB 8594 / NRRL 2338) TaxID=405948 RepID=A4FFC5_SACEN|nr:hypothetical protein [Saccharopolyspora erythraea]EQD82367.1 hypothetical protein N599_31035 [Saccharopolyspora erythraea D]QRK93620.1 hypothetical protein JQX30_17760 [Saccharopolyspora erythraea]CAM02750.1 hypothetical protein SACE_3476 [Saccharopolyspora erythraea NRRL 2338]